MNDYIAHPPQPWAWCDIGKAWERHSDPDMEGHVARAWQCDRCPAWHWLALGSHRWKGDAPTLAAAQAAADAMLYL